MRPNDNKVYTIARTKESTMFYTKKAGRLMTHQLNHPLNGQHTRINQFQHGDQRELNHRHSTGSFGTSTLFLIKQMRSVVCTNNSYSAVIQGLTQEILVYGRLNGRIHLNSCTSPLMVKLGEIKVSYCGFPCNLTSQQFQLFSSRNVGNVQAGAIFPCQFDCLHR